MNFPKLVYFMLNMVNESTRIALDRYFAKLAEETRMSQQAFSEARSKISHQPFLELYRMTSTAPYICGDEIIKWNGYRLFAIDGSAIALPNTAELCKHFGVSGSNADSATAKASIQYDMLNHAIMDAAIGPYGKSEREYAKEHIEALKARSKTDKELAIFDRGYASLDLIAFLVEANVRFVMRVRRKFSLIVDNALQGDTIVELGKEGSAIKMRVIKFTLASGEEETLITDLFDTAYDEPVFKQLYFMRWPIETKFDIIKNKLALENFSGRTVNSIMQDFYVNMYLANMAAYSQNEADVNVSAQREDKNNKYKYQANMNHIIGVLKDDLILACLASTARKRKKLIRAILKRLCAAVVPVRPCRSVPRPISPRNIKFHHNQKMNC